MPENITYTYCAEVTKEASLRFISHLDYAALMERAICRAKLPVVYSEGFNPHMKLSFASALALGVMSESEYMEFILSEGMDTSEVFKRLSEKLPDGVTLKALKQTAGKHKALMALVDQAAYEVSFPLADNMKAWEEAIRLFNAMQMCIFHRQTPKKTRDIDIKQYMAEELRLHVGSDRAVLEINVKITPQGSVKPSEVLTYLVERNGLKTDISSADIKRKSLFSGGKPLMDVL